MEFYLKTLQALVAKGTLDPDASTLVVAGGQKDRAALLAAGFTNVTISNLDTRMKGYEFAPYAWALTDAEQISFDDNSYHQVIDHMGLHHCGSPHRALLEMYRVASQFVLVFENRDSFTLRLATRLGVVPDYEIDAVVGNDHKFGGFRNTAIPNFIYRWTEREVRKVIATIDPAHKVSIEFFYNLRYPSERINSFRGAKRLVLQCLKLPFTIYAMMLPRQANEFGFCIKKRDRALQPWIDAKSGNLALDR